MTDLYKPDVVQAWRSSRSRLSLQKWVDIVARQLPQFSTDDSIYNAIPLTVKIAGNLNAADGNVSMSVNGVTDPEWYSKLCTALSDMTGVAKVKVTDYLGNDISTFSHMELRHAGELDVIDATTGREIRLAAPVEPPKYMSNNKVGELRTWWQSNSDKLAQVVADQLKGKSMPEIAAATVADGPVHKTIEQFLNRNTLHGMTWDKFASTYSMSSHVCQSNLLANGIPQTIRADVKDNVNQIRKHSAMGTRQRRLRGNLAPSCLVGRAAARDEPTHAQTEFRRQTGR